MTRLRIYSGGTGNIQYDSSEDSTQTQNERAREEFNAGILFYYIPGEQEIHGYVKLHRRAEEQFLAVYETDAGDPVRGFKSAVERAAQERDWRIVSASQINQEVFQTLGTDRTRTPNVGVDEIREELNQAGKIDFVAGDGKSAVELFEHLRREFPRQSIAITTTGRSGPASDAKIVIEVDESYSYEQPSAAGESARNLHDRKITADRQALHAQFSRLIESAGGNRSRRLGHRLARTLERASVPDRFGIVFRERQTAKTGFDGLIVASTVLFVAVVGTLLALRFTAGDVSLPLTSDILITLPWLNSEFTLVSWHILFPASVILAMALLTIKSFRLKIIHGLDSILYSISGGGFGGRIRGASADDKTIHGVLNALEQLQSRTQSQERFIQEVKAAVEPFPVHVTTQEAVTKNRRRRQLVSLLVGVSLGAIFPLLASIRGPIFAWIRTNWRVFVYLIGTLAVIGAIGRLFVGLLSWVLLDTSSNGRPSRATAPSAGRTAREQPTGADSTRSTGRSGRQSPPKRKSDPHSSRTDPAQSKSTNQSKNTTKRQNSTSGSSKNGVTTPPAKRNQSRDKTSEREQGRADTRGATEKNTSETTSSGPEKTSADVDSSATIDPSFREESPTSDTQGDRTVEEGGSDPSGASTSRESAAGPPPQLEYLGPADAHSGDEYPMYRYDIANTGHHPGVTQPVDENPGTQWRYAVENGAIRSSPSVCRGRVIVGSYPSQGEGALYALDESEGTQLVHYSNERFFASPTVVDDEVLIGSASGRFYALEWSSLEPRWIEEFTGSGDPLLRASPTATDERIYVTTMSGMLTALNREGERIGNREFDDYLNTTPALDEDHIYVGTSNPEQHSDVVAITHDGGKEWIRSLEGGIVYSPVVVSGTVYAGCDDGKVYALNARTGKDSWRPFDTGGTVSAPPAAAGDMLFVGNGTGTFYGIDRKTGQKRWAINLGSAIESPATVAAGYVYVGDNSGTLHAIGATDGERVWSRQLEGAIKTQPTVVDGRIYVGTSEGHLYALS